MVKRVIANFLLFFCTFQKFCMIGHRRVILLVPSSENF